jgi:hypothetical protein
MPQEAGRLLKQFKYIFWFTIVLLISLGLYCNFTNTSTGGAIYGRYGGTGNVSYGGNGFFVMAAALLMGALLMIVISKLRK